MRIRITKLPKNIKAIGGVLQTHGGDFSDGLITVNAGGSHEENPNDGVQMGIDPEGTPNLVEENETVWNDYVFSARILADDETKSKFHLPKKKDITYAEISKKLEKEIAERPNDPISKAGFKSQMQTLEEQQERQKAEMEAARAREAFEALSPEEQTAVMQNVAQQEQMAQQAAQEQAIAEQQAMQQATPEELAMAQQAQQQAEMPQEMIPAEEGYAYGGNLFDIGGLAWIKKNHPEIKNPEAVAKALEKHMQTNKSNFYAPDDVSMFGGNSDRSYKWQFDRAWKDLMPATTSLSGAEKHFNKWVKAGLSREDAFRLTHSDKIYTQYQGDNRTRAKRDYDSAYTRLVKTTPKQKQRKFRSVDPNDNNLYQSREEAAKASYAYHQAQKRAAKMAQPAKAEAPKVSAEEAPVVQQEKAHRPLKAQTKGSAVSQDKGINVGKFKQEGNHWNEYGLPGLQNYLLNAEASLSDPDITDARRDEIRQGIVDTLNGVQESYYTNIAPTLGKNRQNKSAGVEQHQRMYQNATNNAGFYGVDEDGRYYNKMDMALDKPEGHNTTDNLATGWVDGYSGPQTWLRHMGASGDSLNDVVEQLRNIGIDYSPYNNWTVGEGDNARQLYRASLLNAPSATTVETAPISTQENAVGNGLVEGIDYMVPEEEEGDVVATASPEVDENGNPVTNRKIVPNHRDGWLRYAGLFGPAVGLGMQMAGVGRPDTASLDAAISGAGNVYTADYQPIGNYLTYRPLDIWYEQNRANALSRATDRNIMNTSGGNRGTAMAGLIANGYNSQLASGNLFRQAEESNLAQRERVEAFNRGTNQFNAEAYNRNSQFNASERNRANQYAKQLALHAASQKMNADAGWYNGIYGNVAGLFRGLADLGRENAQYNQMVDLLGTGALPGVTEQKLVDAGLYHYSKEGGKIKRKKSKRGLTI